MDEDTEPSDAHELPAPEPRDRRFVGDDAAALRLDYERTLAVWSDLVGVRFRLLAIVPVLTAAGVGLLGQVDELASLRVALVAILGLLTVVALCMYDLRNSLFHDFAIHRAKVLEQRLRLERTVREIENDSPCPLTHGPPYDGGLFTERPRARGRLLGAQVWHDRALALAYATSAGAWAALATYALVARLGPGMTSATHQWFAALAGVGVALALWAGIWWYDCRVGYFKHTLTAKPRLDERWEPFEPRRWRWAPWHWSGWASDQLVAKWVGRSAPATSSRRPPASPRL